MPERHNPSGMMLHEYPAAVGQEARAAIRSATPDDAPEIARIYNHYIANTTITFEEHPVYAPQMAQRIAALLADGFPWLVVEQDGALAGYAYASQWKARYAYRFSAEATVYLAPERVGQGLGAQLYAHLLAQLKAQGFHVALGCIALPNPLSVALHEKFGMKQVAHFHQAGWKFSQWLDVGYWQVLL